MAFWNWGVNSRKYGLSTGTITLGEFKAEVKHICKDCAAPGGNIAISAIGDLAALVPTDSDRAILRHDYDILGKPLADAVRRIMDCNIRTRDANIIHFFQLGETLLAAIDPQAKLPAPPPVTHLAGQQNVAWRDRVFRLSDYRSDGPDSSERERGA